MGIIVVLTLSFAYWFFQLRLVYLFYKYGIPVDMFAHLFLTLIFNGYLFVYVPLKGLFFDEQQLFGSGLLLVVWGLVLFALAFSVPKNMPKRKKGTWIASNEWDLGEANYFW
ncbi:hypothetical protein [Sporosarcina cyprini]|uniref:hypothetical protein n=1 Tax=Sporosarcina cyprini TaxID=2910523 RepID=UPI001EE0F37C|nr:hypothetical protein [Sporosarcina cyprini]MCG3088513.1 hypothetical protein [Sporosarcina cyprini]